MILERIQVSLLRKFIKKQQPSDTTLAEVEAGVVRKFLEDLGVLLEALLEEDKEGEGVGRIERAHLHPTLRIKLQVILAVAVLFAGR